MFQSCKFDFLTTTGSSTTVQRTFSKLTELLFKIKCRAAGDHMELNGWLQLVEPKCVHPLLVIFAWPLHRAAATLDSTPSSGEHQWTLILFLTVESRPEN